MIRGSGVPAAVPWARGQRPGRQRHAGCDAGVFAQQGALVGFQGGDDLERGYLPRATDQGLAHAPGGAQYGIFDHKGNDSGI